MKKLIAVLMLVIPLCGCIPAAFVVGAAAGGAFLYDKRSMKGVLQDRDSAQIAQNKVNFDKALRKKVHISVAVFNHVGLMVGQAPTPELRDRAYRLVSGTKNISRVYNQVSVGQLSSFSQRSRDSWLTSKVRSAMLAEKGLGSTHIKVVTEDGVVYLMGLLSRSQAAKAVNVARRIRGVQKVVKVFQFS